MIVIAERPVNFILDGGWQKKSDERVERSLYRGRRVFPTQPTLSCLVRSRSAHPRAP
jgi:hypothetical protein